MVPLPIRDWPKSLLKCIGLDGKQTNDLPEDLLPIANKVGHLCYVFGNSYHAQSLELNILCYTIYDEVISLSVLASPY
jgi:hypothetical protein